ncbi:MAG: hypothetical protein JRG75_10630 [Deltaproteobacteria bacterium]|jgi:formate-dependent nitrite reductase cytochrome c552 subunit|nr:hypothetical protein [Deltaproteobacteria bacterium]
MKTPNSKNYLFWILPVLLLILSGLKVYASQDGVAETIKNATAPFEERIDSVPPLPDTAVLVKEKHQGERFWTETRKDNVERFKCSQCHNNKKVTTAKAAEIAHGDIVLVHGGKKKPLQCFTCHKEDERDVLVTEKGVKVDLDHSYQMCGQCHFRQKKDWVGGAHGKRVSYWAGQRVVKNCTACHDPHSPHFEKRWPKTYSPPSIK